MHKPQHTEYDTGASQGSRLHGSQFCGFAFHQSRILGKSCHYGQVGLVSCERYVIEQDLLSLTLFVLTCIDFGQETNSVYSLRLDMVSPLQYLHGQRHIPLFKSSTQSYPFTAPRLYSLPYDRENYSSATGIKSYAKSTCVLLGKDCYSPGGSVH